MESQQRKWLSERLCLSYKCCCFFLSLTRFFPRAQGENDTIHSFFTLTFTSYIIYAAVAALAIQLLKRSDHVRIVGDKEQEDENHKPIESGSRPECGHLRFLML